MTFSLIPQKVLKRKKLTPVFRTQFPKMKAKKPLPKDKTNTSTITRSRYTPLNTLTAIIVKMRA